MQPVRRVGAVLAILIGWAAPMPADTRDQPLVIRVEARDLILGERGMMAETAFRLAVENRSPQPVGLMVRDLSGWIERSQYWKVHVEGPLDPRCKKNEVSFTEDDSLGARPGREIAPGQIWKADLRLAGVAALGSYRVSVEYNGQGAPEGYFSGTLQSPEVTFRIEPPSGVDAEITGAWRDQNPDAPWCRFPVGMTPDITKHSVLFQNYPTSVYAGWALWERLRGHAGGFSGPPSAADPSTFLAAASQEHSRVLYDERIPGSTPGNDQVLRREEAARWRLGVLRAFLDAHPGFVHADEMMLRIAMDSLGLGLREEGIAEFQILAGTPLQTPAVTRATEYLVKLQR